MERALTSSVSCGMRSRNARAAAAQLSNAKIEAVPLIGVGKPATRKNRCDSSTPRVRTRRSRRDAGSSSLGAPLATIRESASKSNASWCGPPIDSLRLCGCIPACAVAERGAQDVREPQHERLSSAWKRRALSSLRGAPGMRDESGRHVAGAAEQLAVGGQGAARLAQHLFQRFAFARAERRRGLLPQLAERAGGTESMARRISSSSCSAWRRSALAFDAARRDVLQHRVDQAAERAHELGHAFARRENDREVVAQGRELAVRRQHRRAQAEAVDRRQAVALAPAGDVKDQLVRGGLGSIATLDLAARSALAHAARVARASSSGQTVNLSSSRFEAGTDVFGRAQLAGVAQVLVARGIRVSVQDADRDRVVERGDLARPVDVDRIVLALVAVRAGEARAELQTRRHASAASSVADRAARDRTPSA